MPSAGTPSGLVLQWLVQPHPLVIGGAPVDARDRGTLSVEDPSTGEVIAHVAAAQAADVDDAVAAARRCFEDRCWHGMRRSARTAVLMRIADLLDSHSQELAQLDALDCGKPLRLALAEVATAADAFRHFAVRAALGEGATTLADDAMVVEVVREPVGVCAAIVPWNYPLLMAAWKLAPALAYGNCVVLKPAEQTPLSALRLGELCIQAGLPGGALSVLPGLGEAAGAALAQHPDVNKVAFTGSTAVGLQIAGACAQRLARVTLELGGKSPNIVLADADLERAVRGSAEGAFRNSGQMCTAGSRVLVQDTILERFVAAFVDAAQRLRVGPALADGVEIGPLVSQAQRERVQAHLDRARAQGAELLSGGQASGPGYFIAPAVMSEVSQEMSIVSDEIFGPVVTIQSFTEVDEAISLANDTKYGLAATVWGSSIGAIRRVTREVRVGTVWVNTTGRFDATVPFGGFKLSGLGRELGAAALEDYTETKSVWVAG